MDGGTKYVTFLLDCSPQLLSTEIQMEMSKSGSGENDVCVRN